jgi:hypothetical protein
VSRIDRNAYKVQGQDAIIITSLCLDLALADNSLLRYVQGAGDNRVFFSDRDDCAVSGVYRTNATLQRVAQDLYKDTRTGGYIQTRYCYVYAYGEDAMVLSDRVLFVDSRESCDLSA